MLSRNPISLAISRYEFAERFVREHRAVLPPGDIYDIGAGDGRMRAIVERIGLSWHGFDLAPRANYVQRWDLDNPKPSEEHNAAVVLMLDVLEHLPNPGLGLRHVAEVMTLGGILVLTMPNPKWGRSRLHALITGYPACFTQTDLDCNGHVFTPWPHIVEKLLKDSGFEVCEYVTLDGRTTWPGPPFSIRYPLRLLHAMGNKIIERLDPTACGMSYGLAARRIA